VVQDLIRERVHSTESLEALLLVRSEPQRDWAHADVASSLRISVALTRAALEALVRSELCQTTDIERGPVRYAPRSEGLAQAVSELARSYEEHRLEVLVFISQSAISRVRTSAIRTFAEAFRFADRKKDG